MSRRPAPAAQALAATLRQIRASAAAAAREARPAKPVGLSTCVLCHRDFVTPVEWERVGKDRWWMFLRCAECGTSREVTVSHEVASAYDDELAIGFKAIAAAARRLDLERMAAEADAFGEMLRHGLVEPADFAR